MNSDGNSCGAGAGVSNFFAKRDNAQSKNIYMNFGGGEPFKSPIPAGTWKVKVDNETVAKFDLAVSYPLIPDSSDQTKLVPRVYIPTLKVTTDVSTHVVEKVEIRLYLWNKVEKNYQLVSSYDTFNSIVSGAWFSLTGRQNGQTVEETMSNSDSYAVPVDEKPLRTMVPEPKWRLQTTDDVDCATPTGFTRLEQINVQMIMYGNRYSFNFMLKKNGCI